MKQIVLFFLLGHAVSGTTYYVASAGSDANSGTSTGAAWQTISKVNAGTYAAGDTISFNGGDTFSGTTLSVALLGSAGNPITLNSYGAGRGTISVGSCSAPSSVHGVSLTNPQYLTIDNLTITGAGWTGSGTSVVVCDGGNGINIVSTNTSGSQMQSIVVTGCTISGFQNGIWIEAGKTSGVSSTVGFNHVILTGNNVSNNLTGGILLQGYNADAGGPVAQNTDIHMDGNIGHNIPGDPNSGTGGVHGTIRTEAYFLDLNNVTGFSMNGNLATDIAGFGGTLSGLTLGGSAAIQVGNSRNGTINSNEVGRTRCSTHFDGAAIDLDQDAQTTEVAYNLSYNNVGPFLQIGSFGGKKTSGAFVHHNVSYNDVRGNNSGGLSEQGVIRIWGNTDANAIFNNTIYADASGTVGVPSAFNFEVGNNTNLKILNNIFKVTGGMAAFWANRTWNSTHLSSSVILGNLYDSSGGSLLISNDNGSSAVNVTTLAAWQALGFETRSSVNYGATGAASLFGLSSFSPPANGFIGTGININSITNFDLNRSSAAFALGIDPSLVGVVLGPVDYHGAASMRGVLVDTGGVSFAGITSGLRGQTTIRGQAVTR